MSQVKKWVRITSVENIPLREGRSVQIGGYDIAIFNLGDRFLAVESRCPHRGGPLADGIVSGTTVVCPLHGNKFNLATGQPVDNECKPIKTYPVIEEDGAVMVSLPAKS